MNFRQCAPLVLLFGLLLHNPRSSAEPGGAPSCDRLLPGLRPYVGAVVRELDQVPPERRKVLDEIAGSIATQLKDVGRSDLTFICTHNSRRSHMSQIWAETAACYFGLAQVQSWSGGTEVTACNCRTVTAMRRVGFDITDVTDGDNPLYLVRYAPDRPPIRAYSKLYNADGNPDRGFIALMVCSSADRSCPVVAGAAARHAIHFMDPRLCDDTPAETAAYNERCREIAREMFFLMSEVRRKIQPVTE
ncbi:MAG: protein-tyrosine-phosphatase [Verrucomicrobiae bacterium]|nr:protein-tyrosine-phosphatase [Verrucomicrobiae bacterium]